MIRGVVTAVVALAAWAGVAQDGAEAPVERVLGQRYTEPFIWVGDKESKATVFDVYRDPSSPLNDTLIVTFGDEVVFSREDDYLGHFEILNDQNLIDGATQDLDGDGAPEVLVRYFTGGANCCYGYLIFSLQGGVTLLGELEPSKTWLTLADFDGDGTAEAKIIDDTFAYWNASGVASPYVAVIARFRDGGFEADPDLMSAHPVLDYSDEEAAARLTEAFADDDDIWKSMQGDAVWAPLSSTVWAVLLDYVYSGKSARGWELVEAAWPEGKQGLDAFRSAFEEELATSPYAAGVAAMNR